MLVPCSKLSAQIGRAATFGKGEMKTIEQVIAENPTLDISGFASSYRCEPEFTGTQKDRVAQFHENISEIEACIDWLSDVNPIKTINRGRTSYGLKHSVERSTGKYISNGSFIMAALMLGYQMHHGDSTNACFGMSEKDIKRKAERDGKLKRDAAY